MFYLVVVVGLIFSGFTGAGVAYFKGYQHAAAVYNAEAVERQLKYERSLTEKALRGQKEAEAIALEANETRENLQKQFDEMTNIVNKITELENKIKCVDDVIVTRLRRIK